MEKITIKLPSQLETFKGIRKTWDRCPIVQIVLSKKKKSRQESKREFQKRLTEEL